MGLTAVAFAAEGLGRAAGTRALAAAATGYTSRLSLRVSGDFSAIAAQQSSEADRMERIMQRANASDHP
jgi:hypothetical protein